MRPDRWSIVLSVVSAAGAAALLWRALHLLIGGGRLVAEWSTDCSRGTFCAKGSMVEIIAFTGSAVMLLLLAWAGVRFHRRSRWEAHLWQRGVRVSGVVTKGSPPRPTGRPVPSLVEVRVAAVPALKARAVLHGHHPVGSMLTVAYDPADVRRGGMVVQDEVTSRRR